MTFRAPELDANFDDGSTVALSHAAAALDNGTIDRARAIYASLASDPQGAGQPLIAGIGLAVCHARQRAWDEAEAVLVPLAGREPGSGIVRAYLGAVRFEQGQIDQAREDLDLAVTLAPEDPVVFIKRGEVALRVGLLRAALADFQQAARLPAPDTITRDYVRTMVISTRKELESSIERAIPEPRNLWRRFRRPSQREGAPASLPPGVATGRGQ